MPPQAWQGQPYPGPPAPFGAPPPPPAKAAPDPKWGWYLLVGYTVGSLLTFHPLFFLAGAPVFVTSAILTITRTGGKAGPVISLVGGSLLALVALLAALDLALQGQPTGPGWMFFLFGLLIVGNSLLALLSKPRLTAPPAALAPYRR